MQFDSRHHIQFDGKRRLYCIHEILHSINPVEGRLQEACSKRRTHLGSAHAICVADLVERRCGEGLGGGERVKEGCRLAGTAEADVRMSGASTGEWSADHGDGG